MNGERNYNTQENRLISLQHKGLLQINIKVKNNQV